MTAQGEIPMPPPNADLQTMWAYLEEGMDHVMTRFQDGFSYSKYMNLGTVAYHYCVSSRSHGKLDSGVDLGGRSQCSLSLVDSSIADKAPRPHAAGNSLMGLYLYNNLIKYFVSHLTDLRNVRLCIPTAPGT